VRFALGEFDSTAGKFWRNKCPHLDRNADMAHLSADSIKKYYPDEFAKIKSYYTFGFVRHPINRFFSGFNETHQSLWSGLEDNSVGLYEYKTTLKNYVNRQLDCSSPEGFYTHVKPQKSVYYFNGQCIADKVIKIEEVEYEVQSLYKSIDTVVVDKIVLALRGKPRNQKKVSLSHTEILERETLNKLVDYYSEDYRIFGYQKKYY
jgi:hypothetical protein